METYEKQTFTDALIATSEVLGRRLSPAAIDGYFESLKRYPLTPVLLSLRETQDEDDRMPAPVRIIARIKTRHMTSAQRADEPNTAWLSGKIDSFRCVCGNDKRPGDPFCVPCWEIAESRQWGDNIRLIESYYLGACATIRAAGVDLQDQDIKPGIKRDGG